MRSGRRSNMPRKNTNQATSIRVLVSGCLPPPMGGMATFYKSLLAPTLPEQVNLAFVNTSSQRVLLSREAGFRFSNILQSFADCWRFARAMMSHKPAVVHVGTAFGLSFVKHSVCVLIARALGSGLSTSPLQLCSTLQRSIAVVEVVFWTGDQSDCRRDRALPGMVGAD